MLYLLSATLIWAFSFSLIKGNLSAVDSNFVAFSRLLISFLLFLPFLKIKEINRKKFTKLFLIGMVQYGLMYVSYIYAFGFLKAHEIILFTITTPIYVVIINDILERKITTSYYITSLIAIFGAGIIVWNDITSGSLIIGFLLMQFSNISFSFGQIYYKKFVTNNNELKEKNIFAILYLGGFITAGIFSFFTTDYSNIQLTNSEFFTILYLGIVASGIGFFLWNYGAGRTNAGSLAIFNNLKIPLALLVSFFFFPKDANIIPLIIGGLLITLALSINEMLINKNFSLQLTKKIK